jgi:hypothetical protein
MAHMCISPDHDDLCYGSEGCTIDGSLWDKRGSIMPPIEETTHDNPLEDGINVPAPEDYK